jgi:O-antigen/teichoic acid export membrane protein
MLSFGLSVLGLELMNTLQANIDKLLIGSFLGTGPLGIYYIAQRILNILTELLTTVVGKVALTTFSRIQQDRGRLVRAFLQMTFASGAIAVPVFGTVAALGDTIVPYVFGPTTSSSVIIMQILAVSAAFAAIVYVDKNLLLAVGRPRQAFTLGLVENIVGITLLAISLPFGLVIVAIGRAARLFVVWPYRLWLLKRYTGLPVRKYLFNVSVIILAIVPSLGTAVALSASSWSHVNLGFWLYATPVGVIMLVLYFTVLWVCCGQLNRAVIRRSVDSFRRR